MIDQMFPQIDPVNVQSMAPVGFGRDYFPYYPSNRRCYDRLMNPNRPCFQSKNVTLDSEKLWEIIPQLERLNTNKTVIPTQSQGVHITEYKVPAIGYLTTQNMKDIQGEDMSEQDVTYVVQCLDSIKDQSVVRDYSNRWRKRFSYGPGSKKYCDTGMQHDPGVETEMDPEDESNLDTKMEYKTSVEETTQRSSSSHNVTLFDWIDQARKRSFAPRHEDNQEKQKNKEEQNIKTTEEVATHTRTVPKITKENRIYRRFTKEDGKLPYALHFNWIYIAKGPLTGPPPPKSIVRHPWDDGYEELMKFTQLVDKRQRGKSC